MFWTGFTFALGAIAASILAIAVLVICFSCSTIWLNKDNMKKATKESKKKEKVN